MFHVRNAGLQGPNMGDSEACQAVKAAFPESASFATDGQKDNCPVALPYNFIAFFILTGIPVFGLCLGQLAGVLVERYQRIKQREALEYEFTEAEFSYCNSIGCDDGQVDWTEFLQITLLKLGVVDQDGLDDIRARFDELDVNGDGSFSKSEMHAMLMFDKYDVDDSDELDIREFACLLNELKYDYGEDASELIKLFRKFSSSYRASVSPDERSGDEEKGVEMTAVLTSSSKDDKDIATVDENAATISRREFMVFWRSLPKTTRSEQLKKSILTADELQIEGVFSEMDTDKSGYLDAREIHTMLERSGADSAFEARTASDVANQIISEYGKNNRVSKNDFLKWWRTLDNDAIKALTAPSDTATAAQVRVSIA